jgi:hypothetical protein
MRKNNNYFKRPLVLIIITAILSFNFFIAYGTDKYVKFTVTDKERIVNNTSEGSSSKYIIFTNRGTFENTDTVFYWKWNSSDLYSSIKKDKTYIAHVYGFRVGFLSLYQNIISAEPL